ncbi:MAG TPA: hypothetical protein VFT87_02515 [Candidatus Saccharimonadales bacterium]|nr:hypothetical protein [Candidatus Saccharimonadales bacterium]
MQLSDSLIAQFQQAHLEEFGQAISAEAAEAELIGLAELVEITGHTHSPTAADAKDGEKNETE